MKEIIKNGHDLAVIQERCNRRLTKARHIIPDLDDVLHYLDKIEVIEYKFDTCNKNTALTVKLDLHEVDIAELVQMIAEKRNRLLINSIYPINGYYTIFFDYNDDWL